MRKPALMLIGLVASAACSGAPFSDEPATISLAETTSTPMSTTTPSPPIGPIRGALPDGTIYDIAFPTPRNEPVAEIEAGLVLEVDDANVPLNVDFRRDSHGGRDAGLLFQAGDWTVEIDVPESSGEEARDLIEGAVEVSTEVDMPVLTLHPPLRWSEPPLVRYDTFVVQSGCPKRAAACNPTHAVSVIPRRGEELEGPISMQSYALRPHSDPNHLRPGPLTARWSPDVLWSGEEMIVWGGSADAGPPQLVDGAAFDPATGRWRLLSAPPLDDVQATRAVWAGTAMIVIAEEATVSWDPNGDQWHVIGDGVTPPLDPGISVVVGSEVFTWPSDSPYKFGANGKWVPMPDPGVGFPGLDGSVLRVVGSQLFSVGADSCDRLVTRWDGEEWSQPTRVSFRASEPTCGHPNQTAVVNGKLVLWDDTSGEVVSYDSSSGAISEEAPFPLPPMEHAPGPLHLDDGFLVSAGLEAAIFDSGIGQWRTVEPPGLGTDVDMVWTGDEVLMWAKCCYDPDDIDAWRWTPPSR